MKFLICLYDKLTNKFINFEDNYRNLDRYIILGYMSSYSGENWYNEVWEQGFFSIAYSYREDDLKLTTSGQIAHERITTYKMEKPLLKEKYYPIEKFIQLLKNRGYVLKENLYEYYIEEEKRS